jgi:hypothetical protein
VAVVLAATALGGGARTAQERATTPSGGWQPMAAAPLSPRLHPVLVGWGDRVVVVGRRSRTHGRARRPPPASTSRTRHRGDAAVYDVPRDAWERLPDAPLPLDVQSAVVLDDVLYVWLAGSDVLSLDLASRTWAQLPDPPSQAECCVRLVAAGNRVVAAPMEVRSGARDVAWLPGSGRWEALPASPLDPAFDRTLTWTGTELVLITAASALHHPAVRAGRSAAGRRPGGGCPPQDVVIGGWPEWSWTGDRLVVATTQRADGGEVDGFGRSIPSGGYLDPSTGSGRSCRTRRRSRTPAPPSPPAVAGSRAARGWSSTRSASAGTSCRRTRSSRTRTRERRGRPGRLVVWGGAVGMARQVDDPPGRSVATGPSGPRRRTEAAVRQEGPR